MADSEKLDKVISMRVSRDDEKLLARVAAAMPAAKPLAVARLAMRRGLELLEKESKRR